MTRGFEGQAEVARPTVEVENEDETSVVVTFASGIVVVVRENTTDLNKVVIEVGRPNGPYSIDDYMGHVERWPATRPFETVAARLDVEPEA